MKRRKYLFFMFNIDRVLSVASIRAVINSDEISALFRSRNPLALFALASSSTGVQNRVAYLVPTNICSLLSHLPSFYIHKQVRGIYRIDRIFCFDITGLKRRRIGPLLHFFSPFVGLRQDSLYLSLAPCLYVGTS